MDTALKLRFQFQPKKTEEVGKGIKAKSKLEVLEKRLFDPKAKDDVEDIMVVERGTGSSRTEEAFEAPDTATIRDVNRRTLGHGALGGRDAISPRNNRAYHRLRLKYRMALERDPDRQEKYTRYAHVLFNDTGDNFKERSVLPKQIDVEVVEQEPLVKYIPVPQWAGRDKWEDKKIE